MEINNLSHADFQKGLCDFFAYYNENLQDIVELATIESNGERPLNIENEIYSAFHHVNRALFCRDTVEEATQELEHALNSHLRRVELDSFKIVINKILEESSRVLDTYEVVLFDPEFTTFFPNSVRDFATIRENRSLVASSYKEAKHLERKGKFEEALAKYNKAVSYGTVLNELARAIEKDKGFGPALVSMQKKQRIEQKLIKDNRAHQWKTVVVTAILTALITFGATAYGDYLDSKSDSSPTASNTAKPSKVFVKKR